MAHERWPSEKRAELARLALIIADIDDADDADLELMLADFMVVAWPSGRGMLQ
jgi:hypothetical protein